MPELLRASDTDVPPGRPTPPHAEAEAELFLGMEASCELDTEPELSLWLCGRLLPFVAPGWLPVGMGFAAAAEKPGSWDRAWRLAESEAGLLGAWSCPWPRTAGTMPDDETVLAAVGMGTDVGSLL